MTRGKRESVSERNSVKIDENNKLKSGKAEPLDYMCNVFTCAIKMDARTGRGEVKTSVTTACPEGRCERKHLLDTRYGLSWRVQAMTQDISEIRK